MKGHGLLLGRRLGVEVHHHDAQLRMGFPKTGEQFVGRLEGRPEPLHKDLPLEVQSGDRHPGRRLPDMEPDARIGRGIVSRPQQSPFRLIEQRNAVAFVPDVVAGGVAVDLQVLELAKDRRCDPETAS